MDRTSTKPRSRARVVTVWLAFFVASVGANQGAASGPSEVRPVTEPVYEIMRLPDEDVPVRFGDRGNTTVHARFFLPSKVAGPDSVLSTEDDVPVPVLVKYTPYSGVGQGDNRYDYSDFSTIGSDLDEGDELAFFVKRGYAVVIADVPGTGKSGGCADLFGRREQQAGYDLVEWVAVQRWSDGRIGMYGNSAPAIDAVLTASARPPHLEVIAIGAPGTDLREVYFHDGVPYSFTDPSQQLFSSSPFLVRPTPTDPCLGWPTLLDITTTLDPEHEAIWAERDWVPDAPRLAEPAPGTGKEVSVLVIGGWRDALLKSPQTVRWFEAIPADDPSTTADEGVPFKLMFMERGQHGRGWEFHYRTLALAMFDEFLYDLDTNIRNQDAVWSLTNGPQTAEPRPEDIPQWLRTSKTWPPDGTETVNLFLREGGALSMKPAKDDGNLGTYMDSGTVTEGEVVDRVRARVNTTGDAQNASFGDFLWFESGPLEEDLRIAGRPFLHVRVTTDKASTHLTPVLFDLGAHFDTPLRTQNPCDYTPGPMFPDLSADPPVDPNDPGGDPVTAARADICTVTRGFLNTRYLSGYSQPSERTPDVPYDASIRFLDEDWIIPKGHRIGLAVMSSNTWWALPDDTRATTTIMTEKQNRSFLELPIVGGKPAAEAAIPRDSDPEAFEEWLLRVLDPLRP